MKRFPALSYPIRPKIFAVFRQWIKKVKEKDPSWEIQLEDENEVMIFFKNEVLAGLAAISKKDDRKHLTDWCIGFMKGYLHSTLSSVWTSSYYKKSNAYRNALWLKATISLLNADEDTRKQVNRLYLLLLENNFALPDSTDLSDIVLNEQEVERHQILADLSCDENWAKFKTFLEDLLYTYYLEQSQKDDFDIKIPEIDGFFTYQELEELILKNPFLYENDETER